MAKSSLKPDSMRSKLAHFFLRNAQIKAGVPAEDLDESAPGANRVEIEHRHKHETTSAAGGPQSSGDSNPSSAPSLLRRLLPYVVTAALAGGGAGAAGYFLNPDDPEPRSGSLLQDLEDRGFHVPPEAQ